LRRTVVTIRFIFRASFPANCSSAAKMNPECVRSGFACRWTLDCLAFGVSNSCQTVGILGSSYVTFSWVFRDDGVGRNRAIPGSPFFCMLGTSPRNVQRIISPFFGSKNVYCCTPPRPRQTHTSDEKHKTEKTTNDKHPYSTHEVARSPQNRRSREITGSGALDASFI